MLTETIHTLNGLHIEAELMTAFESHKVFLAQQRMVLTDAENNEIENIDVINFLSGGKGIISRQNEKGSLANVVNLVGTILAEDEYKLHAEAIASAFIALKEDPSLSIEDALNIGVGEWYK